MSTILSADRISSNSLRGLRNADPPASATRSETGESPWQSAPRKWQSMPPLSTLFVRGTAICVKLFCQFHTFCLEVMWVWQLFLLYSWRTSVHKFKTKKGFFFVSGPFQWQSLLLSTPERGADVCSLRQVFVSQLSNSVINATKLKAGSTLSKRRFKKTNIRTSMPHIMVADLLSVKWDICTPQNVLSHFAVRMGKTHEQGYFPKSPTNLWHWKLLVFFKISPRSCTVVPCRWKVLLKHLFGPQKNQQTAGSQCCSKF